jgi:HK97 family phage major capsid protein
MTPQEVKAAVDQINREWNELKGVLQGRAADEQRQFGEHLGETKAKMDAISARLDQLEVKLSRPGAGAGQTETERQAEVQMKRKAAFDKLLRKGLSALDQADREILGKKVMTVGDDTTGGFGTSSEMEAGIVKGVIDLSPWRDIVSVRNTSKRSVKVMKRTGTFAAVWVSETGTRSETTGLKYGLEEIPNHEIYALVDVSRQDLEDAEFDLEGELKAEAAEQFAVAEGAAIWGGSGSGKPEGINVNAAVASDNSGSAAAVTYSGFVDVSHNIKAGYLANCRFIMNLNTLGKARQLVSGTGELLWTPMAGGAPATILGFPYTIIQDMPNQSAGVFPVAFGDFKRAYKLVDRVAMEVLRDDVTQATSGAVRFIIRKRLGGQVVVAEAIRKMKCAV